MGLDWFILQSRLPKGWDPSAQALWLEGHRIPAIQKALEVFNQYPVYEKPKGLLLQTSYYFWGIQNWPAVIEFLSAFIDQHADDFTLCIIFAHANHKMGHSAVALQWVETALKLNSNDFSALDLKVEVLANLERFDEMAEVGKTVLFMKAGHGAVTDPAWSLPCQNPSDYVSEKPVKSVIAFSLWGAHPRYLRGALDNVLAAQDLYPDWVCRFYADDTVPKDFIFLLKQLDAEVVLETQDQSQRQKLCRRFMVSNDPDVGRFLVRDTDSVVSERERESVNAWIASEKWFHVMRDHWTHTDIMLAGLWGGIAGVLPDLTALLSGYTLDTLEDRHEDQWFLRDKVWPYVRQSCSVHDRYFYSQGTDPWPSETPSKVFHVGQNEYAVRQDQQAVRLKSWIDQYPCLQDQKGKKNDQRSV